MEVLGNLRRLSLRAGIAILIAILALALQAQTRRAPEPEVKAGFLLNFAKLTEWPDSAFKSSDSPFVIAVFGDDPITEYLETAGKNRTIHGRAIHITRFRRTTEVTNCHAIFIALSEREKLSAILKSIQGHPILSISELEKFGSMGGIIRLLKDKDSRLRFEVERSNANTSRLKLSSQLLALARQTENKESR